MADSIEHIANREEQNDNLLFYNFNAGINEKEDKGRENYMEKQEAYSSIPRPSGRNDSSRGSTNKYFNHPINENMNENSFD